MLNSLHHLLEPSELDGKNNKDFLFKSEYLQCLTNLFFN